MNFKLARAALLSLLIILLGACASAPTPTPTPVPTATAIPTATPVPATATPTVPPTATATATPTRVPPTLTVTPTLTRTPTPSPRDLLVNAFTSAVQKIKTYTVRVIEEGRYIAVVLPDRYFQIESDQVMKVGPTVYFYDIQGQLVTRNLPTPYFDRVNLNNLRDQVLQIKQATTLPPATIDGVQCIGYQTTFTLMRTEPPKTPGATPQVTTMNQTVNIWLSTKDGFPKQITLGAPTSLTMIFADINEKIEITPP